VKPLMANYLFRQTQLSSLNGIVPALSGHAASAAGRSS
jgi:hypothetical protein